MTASPATAVAQEPTTANDDLEARALLSRDEFVERASHELRTPLTGLQLYLEMVIRLLDEDRSDVRLGQYARAALGQARRLAALVNDLQDAARVGHGPLTISPRPLELAPVVREAVELAQVMAQGQRVKLTEEGRPLRVKGDAERLGQVVVNLLTNAIKYAPRTERIDVRLSAHDGQAELEVQDYGPGIPRELVPQLFSRYRRAQAEGAGSGLGLGLFISREIVTAHDGTIDVRTADGAGATFIVRLPLLPS